MSKKKSADYYPDNQADRFRAINNSRLATVRLCQLLTPFFPPGTTFKVGDVIAGAKFIVPDTFDFLILLPSGRVVPAENKHRLGAYSWPLGQDCPLDSPFLGKIEYYLWRFGIDIDKKKHPPPEYVFVTNEDVTSALVFNVKTSRPHWFIYRRKFALDIPYRWYPWATPQDDGSPDVPPESEWVKTRIKITETNPPKYVEVCNLECLKDYAALLDLVNGTVIRPAINRQPGDEDKGVDSGYAKH